MATSSVSSSTAASTVSPSSTATTSSATPVVMTDAQIAAANKAAAQSLVSSLGAGSGVDVTSLAQNLVNAEKVPQQNAINAKINKNDARISGLSAISYVVTQVQTAFAALKDQSSFNTLTASNSNSAAFDVTASTSANIGSHSVAISQLAHAQRSVSAGLASASTSLNNGQAMSLSLAVGNGNPISISVVAGSDTPQGVVDAINASSGAATAGVTAQLVNTGDNSGAPYKIVLTGALGASNSFTITGLPKQPTAVTPPTVVTTQGVTTVNDSSSVTFPSLSAGQSVTVAGVTYTATANTSAYQVMSAFAGMASGANYSNATYPTTGNPLGKLDGTLSGYSADAYGTLGGTLGFTSTSGNPSGLDVPVASANVNLGGNVPVINVQSTAGTQGSTESSIVTFQPLSAGQSVTVAGLTYTASVASTAVEVANAFSNLSPGSALPSNLPKGVISGNLSGFSSISSHGASLLFTSTAPNNNVSDITVSSSSAPLFSSNDQSNQLATDALMTVDGIGYKRSTNSITDVITGVTLALKDLTPSGSPATINLTRDTSTITTNINTGDSKNPIERPDFKSLREIGDDLSDAQMGLAVHTQALANWHHSHQFCARCGATTTSSLGGSVRKCDKDASEHYPRTDPAIIVLVKDKDDRILLGRQAVWPEHRFSNFAGFVEPGESFEHAVAREVTEESGLSVDEIIYLGSQPWPFPASVMIAFHAVTHNPAAARPDGTEIVEVRWYSRQSMKQAIIEKTLLLPPAMSVSRRMLEAWYASDGSDIAELTGGERWQA